MRQNEEIICGYWPSSLPGFVNHPWRGFLIKTLFYTGVRVSELVSIRLADVDVERCQIRITRGKGGKDRQVPFPVSFRELLALHMQRMQEKQATHLFESVRKKKYMDSGVRKMLER